MLPRLYILAINIRVSKNTYILALNKLKRTEQDETFIEYLLQVNDQNILLKLLPAGQILNKPVPLFSESKFIYFIK